MDSSIDYRKLAHHASGLYFCSDSREEDLQRRFDELTNKNPIVPLKVEIEMGRELILPRTGGCIAFSTFSEMCEKPLGAADYLAVARAKHSLALSGIPIFTASTKSAAYRFVTLIDILYENKIRFLCAAAGSPMDLFAKVHMYKESKSSKFVRSKRDTEDDIIDDNLGFAKDRTISRLIEMQSTEYLVAHAEMHASELLLALQEEKSRKRFTKR